jgi:outer membrane protein
MPMSSRATRALGLGLGLLATATLVAQSQAQGPNDASVRKSSTQGASATTPGTAPPMRVGTIDMQKVINDYKKYKFSGEQLKNAYIEKQGELNRVMAQMKQVNKEMEGLDPAGNDFKAKETRMTELKAEFEAKKEQAQADMTRREAEALATIYKEIHAMTERVAKFKGYNYIIRVSNEPVSGSDPNLVMSAIARAVVYADSTHDITDMVILNLNDSYEKQQAAEGNPPASAATSKPAAAAAPTRRAPATGTQTKGR